MIINHLAPVYIKVNADYTKTIFIPVIDGNVNITKKVGISIFIISAKRNEVDRRIDNASSFNKLALDTKQIDKTLLISTEVTRKTKAVEESMSPKGLAIILARKITTVLLYSPKVSKPPTRVSAELSAIDKKVKA